MQILGWLLLGTAIIIGAAIVIIVRSSPSGVDLPGAKGKKDRKDIK